MPKVITAREAEEMLRKGEQPPAGSILTPSARDVLGGGSLQPSFKGTAAAKAAAMPGGGPATIAEIAEGASAPRKFLEAILLDLRRRRRGDRRRARCYRQNSSSGKLFNCVLACD